MISELGLLAPRSHAAPRVRESFLRSVFDVTGQVLVNLDVELVWAAYCSLLKRLAQFGFDYEWRADWDDLVLPVLRKMPDVREIARRAGVDPSTITRLRQGAHPRQDLRTRVTRIVAVYARSWLREAGFVAPSDDRAALKAYLNETR